MVRAISELDFSYNAVAIEDELNTASLNFTVANSEITSFSDAWGNFLPGKPSLTIDIGGSADLAGGQGDATIFADLGLVGKAWDAEPDGTTGYNGFGHLTSYTLNMAVNAPITYSASIQHTGGSVW